MFLAPVLESTLCVTSCLNGLLVVVVCMVGVKTSRLNGWRSGSPLPLHWEVWVPSCRDYGCFVVTMFTIDSSSTAITQSRSVFEKHFRPFLANFQFCMSLNSIQEKLLYRVIVAVFVEGQC